MPVQLQHMEEAHEIVRVGRHPRYPVDVLWLGEVDDANPAKVADAWDAALRIVDVLMDADGMPAGTAALVVDLVNAQVRPARELIRMTGAPADRGRSDG